MKRYIKSGRYLDNGYYLSDEEEAELQYYAEHPDILDATPEPTSIYNAPENFNFLEHKNEIDEAIAEANAKFGDNWEWRAEISDNALKIYWGYFEYLSLENPYIEITYKRPESQYDVWFNIIDPNGSNLSWKVEFNDSDLNDLIVGLAGYISDRW